MDALGLIELCSIARGAQSADAMVKRAPVRLVHARATHPGKFTILVRGGVDEVDEAIAAGRSVAADALLDTVRLPNPHDGLLAVLDAPVDGANESLAVIETLGVASVIRAADAALKAAEVEPRRLVLARDVGGKGYFVLTGELHDVEAAVDAGVAAVGDGMLFGREIIARPHPDLASALLNP